MLLNLRIWRLKRKARSLSVKINRIYDQYSCGASMINTITGGRLGELEKKRSVIFDKLRKIDPNFPGAK